MKFIPEALSASVVTHALAYEAARGALIAASEESTRIFPVVLGQGRDEGTRFSVKSASSGELTGLKIGAYWPGNEALGLPRHNSTIILLDQQTGRIASIIEGGLLNAYRTAAADAVAVDVLARKNARTLTIFGTGHQAGYEVRAVVRVRDFERILVVGRDPHRTEAFCLDLISAGLPAQASSAESACLSADVVITATTAHAPLFEAKWIQPGTHISAMGTDGQGKQELPPALFRTAKLFSDLATQSRRIGEFQHASPHHFVTDIGWVLTGQTKGRASSCDITVFDSSGLAVQDLFIGCAVTRLLEGNAEP